MPGPHVTLCVPAQGPRLAGPRPLLLCTFIQHAPVASAQELTFTQIQPEHADAALTSQSGRVHTTALQQPGCVQVPRGQPGPIPSRGSQSGPGTLCRAHGKLNKPGQAHHRRAWFTQPWSAVGGTRHGKPRKDGGLGVSALGRPTRMQPHSASFPRDPGKPRICEWPTLLGPHWVSTVPGGGSHAHQGRCVGRAPGTSRQTQGLGPRRQRQRDVGAAQAGTPGHCGAPERGSHGSGPSVQLCHVPAAKTTLGRGCGRRRCRQESQLGQAAHARTRWESHKDALSFQIVNFLPSNGTAPRVDCAFLVSARPHHSRVPLSAPQQPARPSGPTVTRAITQSSITAGHRNLARKTVYLCY